MSNLIAQRFTLLWLLGCSSMLSAQPVSAEKQDFLDTLWLSVGSREPLNHAGDMAYTAPTNAADFSPPGSSPALTYGLVPYIDTEPRDDGEFYPNDTQLGQIPPVPIPATSNRWNKKGQAYPTVFNSQTVQGVFQVPGAPTTEHRNLTNKNTLLTGGYQTAIWNVETGLGVTRDAEFKEPDVKRVVGAQSLGVVLKGGTGFDEFAGFGNLSFTGTALQNPTSQESGTDWKYRQWFVDTMVSALNQAFIGSPIDVDTALAADSDVLWSTPSESSLPETRVDNLVGSTNYIAVDNAKFKRGGVFKTGNEFNPKMPAWKIRGAPDLVAEGGRIESAHVFFAEVCSFIPGAFINVGKARDMVNSLNVLPEPTDDSTLTGHTSDSQIDSWTGLEIRRPLLPKANPVQLSCFIGMQIYTQARSTVSSLGDLPLFNGAYRLKRSDIYLGGHAVIGDGISDAGQTGYSSDVFHARDAIRLKKFQRTTLPNLAYLPAWEQTGHLAFVDSDGLYISMAKVVGSNPPSISWVRLNHIRPSAIPQQIVTATEEMTISGASEGISPSLRIVNAPDAGDFRGGNVRIELECDGFDPASTGTLMLATRQRHKLDRTYQEGQWVPLSPGVGFNVQGDRDGGHTLLNIPYSPGNRVAGTLQTSLSSEDILEIMVHDSAKPNRVAMASLFVYPDFQ